MTTTNMITPDATPHATRLGDLADYVRPRASEREHVYDFKARLSSEGVVTLRGLAANQMVIRGQGRHVVAGGCTAMMPLDLDRRLTVVVNAARGHTEGVWYLHRLLTERLENVTHPRDVTLCGLDLAYYNVVGLGARLVDARQADPPTGSDPGFTHDKLYPLSWWVNLPGTTDSDVDWLVNFVLFNWLCDVAEPGLCDALLSADADCTARLRTLLI